VSSIGGVPKKRWNKNIKQSAETSGLRGMDPESIQTICDDVNLFVMTLTVCDDVNRL